MFENYYFKFTATSARGQWIKLIYRWNWMAETPQTKLQGHINEDILAYLQSHSLIGSYWRKVNIDILVYIKNWFRITINDTVPQCLYQSLGQEVLTRCRGLQALEVNCTSWNFFESRHLASTSVPLTTKTNLRAAEEEAGACGVHYSSRPDEKETMKWIGMFTSERNSTPWSILVLESVTFDAVGFYAIKHKTVINMVITHYKRGDMNPGDTVKRCRLTSVKIRGSHDCGIFILGFPILLKQHLYIQSAHCIRLDEIYHVASCHLAKIEYSGPIQYKDLILPYKFLLYSWDQ